MCGFRQFVCWCCLWEVILFFYIYFLLKRALLLICYCCSLFILVLYVITQCVANEICCINKRALLWSFCILTDSLIIVKHCTRLNIQKNYANMPFVLRSGLYLTVQEMPCLSIFVYNTRRMTVVPCLNPNSPMEQSGPIQLGSQLHSPVSGIKAPWPWHWSGHWALGSSQWTPPQPGLQWHSPFTQIPLLEHVGSRQSTALRGKPYEKTIRLN